MPDQPTRVQIDLPYQPPPQPEATAPSTFTIELPDGRKMKAQAADEAAAISGAQQWWQQNQPKPQEASQAPQAGPAPSATDAAQQKQGGNFADYLWQALEPITSYPETYKAMNKDSREQMSRGVDQLAGKESADDNTAVRLGKGVGNVALGAAAFVTSPVNAALRSVAGRPIERATGLPKEYTEFGLGLAIPGLGLTKMPGKPSTFPAPLRTAEKILSPETVSPEAMDAAMLIRGGTGEAARATETTAAQLEPYYKSASQLPKPDQWNIQNYIDGGKSATVPATPELRALTDTLKASFAERKAQLMALPAHAQAAFRDDFFPHMWKDRAAATSFVKSWGIGKQGSGASLKARSIPTFEDGIKAGLEPMYDNPVDGAMRYMMSMDKFIAAEKILQEATDSGVAVHVNPKVIGASGRPNSLTGIPQGYVELSGRGGKGYYAPENWARIYNNWISPGFEQFPTGGKVYDAARKFTNAMTQSLLGLSGYHAFTMAEAAMSTDIARAVGSARGMRAGDVLKAIGQYPAAGIRYAYRSRKYKDIYLDKARNVSPQDKEIVDLLTQAGGRFTGTRHTLDYEASALGDFLTSFRRAQIRSQAATQVQQIKAAPVTGTAKVVLSNLARTLETINKPLFQHYIPSVKNGAQTQLMADFLKANPNATQAEKLANARRIVDSVDNRFGEMIQDNIFWNKMFKQTSILAMLSYSWNMGGWREIGGGLRDVARTAVGRAGSWSAKSDYVVATAMNWAILSAVYQYMKTGQKPTDTDTPIRDLMAPRTGGVDARSGEPERIIPPGIMKDVFGYYEHPMQEAANKLNPGLKAVGQTMTNSDWRGDPIFQPRSEGQSIIEQMPTWLGNLFEHVAKTGTPISMQNFGKREEGSNISGFEKALGIRTAPPYLTNPEGYEAMMRRVEQRKWYGNRGRGGKVGHDKAERSRYGGPQ